MNYLTHYYKNLAEQLQERVNHLQKLLNEEGDMQRDAEEAEDAEDQAALDRLKASGKPYFYSTRKEMREIMKNKERRQRARDAGVDPDAAIGSAIKGQNFLGRADDPNVPAPTSGTDSKPEPAKEPKEETELERKYREAKEFDRMMKQEEWKWRGGGIS